MIAPQWLRLDNAAIIYPSSRTRRYATQFRVSVTLDNEVSVDILDTALKNIMPRFPGFSYTLGNAFFLWYLHRLENAPQAGEADNMNVFSLKRNGGYMFRASANGNQIALDVFHALTDGTGAMTFLMTLTAEYLRLKDGITPEYGGWVLDPAQEPDPEEIQDGFDAFSGLKGSLDNEAAAWHIPGTVERYDILHNARISMTTEEISQKAREYGCTVTELLSSLFIAAMQQTRSQCRRRQRNGNIKVEVPVNLRPIFGCRTLRNFSSYVHLGVDVSKGDLPLEEIIAAVRAQKKEYVQKAPLTTRVAANVALEDNLAVRCLPRFIKRPCINIVNKLKGDRYASQTLSNLGDVRLPASVAAHVRDVDFILGRAMGKSGACACASFGGHLNLNFTRRIKENDFERNFLTQLGQIGINARVLFDTVAEKNNRYEAIRIPMRPVRIGRLGAPLFI